MEFTPTPANVADIAEEIRLSVRRKLVLRPELREGLRLGLEAGLSTVAAVDLAMARVMRERAAVERDWAETVMLHLGECVGNGNQHVCDLLASAVEMLERSAAFLEGLAGDQERVSLASVKIDFLAAS